MVTNVFVMRFALADAEQMLFHLSLFELVY